MEDMTSWVGMLVFGCGLYCFYAAFQLHQFVRAKGRIFILHSSRSVYCRIYSIYSEE